MAARELYDISELCNTRTLHDLSIWTPELALGGVCGLPVPSRRIWGFFRCPTLGVGLLDVKRSSSALPVCFPRPSPESPTPESPPRNPGERPPPEYPPQNAWSAQPHENPTPEYLQRISFEYVDLNPPPIQKIRQGLPHACGSDAGGRSVQILPYA